MPRSVRWSLAFAVALGLHAAFVVFLPEPPVRPILDDWGALVMFEPSDVVWTTAPSLPPEPPEPPPQLVPTPREVAADDLAPSETVEAPPDVVPDPGATGREAVQGLDVHSVTVDGGGPALRVGNTLRVPATARPHEELPNDGAIAWSAAPRPPHCPPPQLEVPDEVVDARLEGEVHLRFRVEADGRVRNVRVVGSLSDVADRACVAAWEGVVCRPAHQQGEAVAVRDMPFACRFERVRR